MSGGGKSDDGEFLWLMSLSDLMILLFVFFVVLYSFAAKKMSKVDYQKAAAALNNKKAPETPVDSVHKEIKKIILDKKLAEMVTIENVDDVLVMQIKDQVLFDSGEFDLSFRGNEIIKMLGEMVNKVPAPYKIGIEGHTDDIPIHTKNIADNWQLSSMRAHAILMSLKLDKETIKRAVVMGYGEMQPLVPNRNPAGIPIPQNQIKNRRVTLRIF